MSSQCCSHSQSKSQCTSTSEAHAPHWKKLRLVEYADCSFPSELARLVLSVSGEPHESVGEHIDKEDWWKVTIPSLEARYAYGRLPVLDVDGVQLTGANVIARFLAEHLGLSGKNAVDAALCASIADAVDETGRGFDPKLKDEAARWAAMAEWKEGGFREWQAKLDKYVAAHVGPSGYLVADQLTWADLAVVTFWDVGEAFDVNTYKTLREKYPALAAHADRVCAEPRVKAYRDKHRPLKCDPVGCGDCSI